MWEAVEPLRREEGWDDTIFCLIGFPWVNVKQTCCVAFPWLPPLLQQTPFMVGQNTTHHTVKSDGLSFIPGSKSKLAKSMFWSNIILSLLALLAWSSRWPTLSSRIPGGATRGQQVEVWNMYIQGQLQEVNSSPTDIVYNVVRIDDDNFSHHVA